VLSVECRESHVVSGVGQSLGELLRVCRWDIVGGAVD